MRCIASALVDEFVVLREFEAHPMPTSLAGRGVLLGRRWHSGHFFPLVKHHEAWELPIPEMCRYLQTLTTSVDRGANSRLPAKACKWHSLHQRHQRSSLCLAGKAQAAGCEWNTLLATCCWLQATCRWNTLLATCCGWSTLPAQTHVPPYKGALCLAANSGCKLLVVHAAGYNLLIPCRYTQLASGCYTRYGGASEALAAYLALVRNLWLL